jgi:anthranilate synthase component 2
MNILIVDHYDSFTGTLENYLARSRDELGEKRIDIVDRVQYDQVEEEFGEVENILEEDYDALVVSPGPGNPENEEDISPTDDILRDVSPEIPTFGVCLGMEAMASAYGGSIEEAPSPIHGKSEEINNTDGEIFEDIEVIKGGRYHSLVADEEELPDELNVTAYAEQEGEELIMALEHEDYPMYGVQFHPESMLTAGKTTDGEEITGQKIIDNFLEITEEYEI